jgi:hypothetical protein
VVYWLSIVKSTPTTFTPLSKQPINHRNAESASLLNKKPQDQQIAEVFGIQNIL